MIQYGSVGPPWWDDRPVAIIGGGTSLKGFDINKLNGPWHVLAVNGSIFDCPWADAGFSLDRPGVRRWWDAFRKVEMPLYFAVDRNREWIDKLVEPAPASATFLRRDPGAALSNDLGAIYSGSSSGFGALAGLARLKRARQIVLFGFDYHPGTGLGPKVRYPRNRGLYRHVGEWHHNEQHYPPQRRLTKLWAEWATRFDAIADDLAADGVEVINASPTSRITAFPKCTVAEGLEQLRAWAAEADVPPHSLGMARIPREAVAI